MAKHKYRVWMHIAGGMGMPSYDGYVDVYACDEEEAGPKAKRSLRHTSFPDVSPSEMRVESVEERR